MKEGQTEFLCLRRRQKSQFRLTPKVPHRAVTETSSGYSSRTSGSIRRCKSEDSEPLGQFESADGESWDCDHGDRVEDRGLSDQLGVWGQHGGGFP